MSVNVRGAKFRANERLASLICFSLALILRRRFFSAATAFAFLLAISLFRKRFSSFSAAMAAACCSFLILNCSACAFLRAC